MNLMEIMKEKAAEQGFAVNWVESTWSISHRENNRGVKSIETKVDRRTLKVEIHGKDSYNLNRHRLVSGSGEKLEQALEQVIAEISFIKKGKA